ncbi:MAG: PAS domain S-box protein [Myxococcota bacterium]|nr:PAS domain S-box protein [Myxococcota bacterium]
MSKEKPEARELCTGEQASVLDEALLMGLRASVFSNTGMPCCIFERVCDDAGKVRDLRVLDVNPAYSSLFQLPASQARGSLITQVFPKAEQTEFRLLFEAAERGTPYSYGSFFAERGRHLQVSLFCPRPGYLVALLLDVSESVLLVRRGQGAEALQRMAGRVARLGGWFVDLETMVCEWSEEVAAIHAMPLAYSPKVEEGIRFYAPEWRERITQVFEACARDGEPYDEEMQIINAHGERLWIRTIGQALRDAEGRIVGVQGAFQDISEQQRYREEFERHLEELRRWQGLSIDDAERRQALKREVNALCARLGEPPRYASVEKDG